MSTVQTLKPVSGKPDIAAILQKLQNADAHIAVIGLGYVGLPLVESLFSAGFQAITGFDVDTKRVDVLNAGQSPIKHISGEKIHEIATSGKFKATNDFSNLGAADAIIICVPTPLTKQREPDLKYVVETTKTIAQHLRAGQLITLESTTYPGTTTEVMRPLLEKETGLKSGEDFFLAYSPEREDPGNEKFSASNTPKVVGGDGANALKLASALYGKFISTVVEVSSPETAEAVKLTENIFRSVNIALVNELKIIYAKMGIDVWEVIEAAKTKPFGYMPFYPGPGLGGHCIPIDPFYLTWKAREFDLNTRFIELAGEINSKMVRYVTNNLAEALSEHAQKSIKGSKILLLGVAYKKNVDDMRESPSLKIWETLEGRGAQVDYHDPYIPSIPNTREHKTLTGRSSVALDPAVIRSYDAVFLATDHDNLDYKMLFENASLILDSRNGFEQKGFTGLPVVKT
ncbi:MAG: nucleotide sugar dehydrogenase [Alphaproteobacteria bacterium]